MQQTLSVLALVKGKERYLFVYDDESRAMLIDTIRNMAADPTVTLSWFDAAALTERAKRQAEETATPFVPTPTTSDTGG